MIRREMEDVVETFCDYEKYLMEIGHNYYKKKED
jgi:hypothetical protein